MGVDVQNMIYNSHLERNAIDELFDIDRMGLEGICGCGGSSLKGVEGRGGRPGHEQAASAGVPVRRGCEVEAHLSRGHFPWRGREAAGRRAEGSAPEESRGDVDQRTPDVRFAAEEHRAAHEGSAFWERLFQRCARQGGWQGVRRGRRDDPALCNREEQAPEVGAALS